MDRRDGKAIQPIELGTVQPCRKACEITKSTMCGIPSGATFPAAVPAASRQDGIIDSA
jgi:hypothetical protein